WPINSCTAFSGTPRITRCEANVCRKTCQVILRSPACLHARHIGHLHSFSLYARPVSVQKTQLTAKVSLRLERRERVAAERELAVAAALRRAHVSTPVAAPHDEAARHQVDVVPAQGPQLADAQPGP